MLFQFAEQRDTLVKQTNRLRMIAKCLCNQAELAQGHSVEPSFTDRLAQRETLAEAGLGLGMSSKRTLQHA